jgi:hypothetical protein
MKENEEQCPEVVSTPMDSPLDFASLGGVVQCRSLEGHARQHWAGDIDDPLRWTTSVRGLPVFYCQAQYTGPLLSDGMGVRMCGRERHHNGTHWCDQTGMLWEAPVTSVYRGPVWDEGVMSKAEVRAQMQLGPVSDYVMKEILDYVPSSALVGELPAAPRSRTERKKRRR